MSQTLNTYAGSRRHKRAGSRRLRRGGSSVSGYDGFPTVVLQPLGGRRHHKKAGSRHHKKAGTRRLRRGGRKTRRHRGGQRTSSFIFDSEFKLR